MLRRVSFEIKYRLMRTPWDTGITPPEVVEAVAREEARGRALDLGCGTGTNSIYLAQHGLTVVGIDFSPKAIATARQKAKRAGVAVDFQIADVTQLDFLDPPFDYVLDLGCFHALDQPGQTRYARSLTRLTRPGSLFMLYAFGPRPTAPDERAARFGAAGVTEERVKALLAPSFQPIKIQVGTDRGNRRSVWYWFARTGA